MPRPDLFGIEVITPPATLPVTIAVIKEHARLVGSDVPDDYITQTIGVATEYIQTETGRRFISQTLDITIDRFPGYVGNRMNPYAFNDNRIELPIAPIASVTSITYLEPNNDTPVVLQVANYITSLVREPCRILPAANTVWPFSDPLKPDGVKIRVVAGYANQDAVPYLARQAICFMCAHLLYNRNDYITGTIVAKLPVGIQSMVNKLKYDRYVG